MNRFRSFSLFIAAIFTLGACAPRQAAPITITAQLAGENEVPAVATTASGETTATLSGNTLTVSGSFTGLMSDLREVAGSPAHIHRGAAGENGPIVFNLNLQSADRRSGSFSGTFNLNDEQLALFREGNMYVNIHTQNNPPGELRAQLAANTPTFAAVSGTFDATLLPENEVHDVESNATGNALGILRADNTMTISGFFSGLSSPLRNVAAAGPAHIHNGMAGETGGIAFVLNVAAGNNMMGGRFGLSTSISAEQLEQLRRGGYYVNIHSENFPQGEIRGQLFRTTVSTDTTLSGEQEVHDVETNATGSARATMNGFMLNISGTFANLGSDLFNVGAVGSAHIHNAPRGANGPVVFPLNVSSDDNRNGSLSLEVELSEMQRADFIAGRYYVNIHTETFRQGELRGQLEPFGRAADATP